MANKRPPSLPADPACYSIDEFCSAHRMSRSALYNQWKAGIGPRFFRNGKKVLISVEAAAAYRRSREAAEQAAA
jgi:hypothetical protein